MDLSAGSAETTVVVIGAGPTGLTLANMLQHDGIPCVLLERRDREFVESRQRAGIVDNRVVEMYRDWGLSDALGGPPDSGCLEFRVNGESHLVNHGSFLAVGTAGCARNRCWSAALSRASSQQAAIYGSGRCRCPGRPDRRAPSGDIPRRDG